MTHLTDKIAEFVFEELSPSEMAGARQHLAECDDCRRQVAQLQHTYTILKATPDVEPPRPVIFEFEKPARLSRAWLWLSPAGAAIAASLLTAILMRPAPEPAPALDQVVVEQSKEIELLRTQVDYLERLQMAIRRDTMENTTSIQQLAEKTRVQTQD